MRSGFLWIFWGLVLVALHIRVGGFDLLPDFIGYLLIFKGLGSLSPVHSDFRKARPLALVMVFVSVPSLFKPAEANIDAPLARRQILSAVTGRLGDLLPEQIGSARLVRSTTSPSELDSSRTHNPAEEKDRVLGQYSDGTRVLILRYSSADAAVSALHEKAKAEYSSDEIRKHLGPGSKADVSSIHAGSSESVSGNVKTAVSSSTFGEALDIEQWWNLGWVLGSPSTWSSSAGWCRTLLFIVEGDRASAGSYKSALSGNPLFASASNTGSQVIGGNLLGFQGIPRAGQGIALSPVSPILMIGSVLDTVLIWLICTGIIGLASAHALEELVGKARTRRVLYVTFKLALWPVPALLFAAPALFSDSERYILAALMIINALAMLVTLLLILALVRECAAIFAHTIAEPIRHLPEPGAFGGDATI